MVDTGNRWSAVVFGCPAEALLTEQLDIMRIHADQLSPEARAALHNLAGASSELQLSRPTDASIASAWAALVCEDLAAQRMQASLP